MSLFKQLEMFEKVLDNWGFIARFNHSALGRINIFNSDICYKLKWTVSQSSLAVFNNISSFNTPFGHHLQFVVKLQSVFVALWGRNFTLTNMQIQCRPKCRHWSVQILTNLFIIFQLLIFQSEVHLAIELINE